MNGGQIAGADAASEPQIIRIIRDANDCRDRAEVLQNRVEAMLSRVRGSQPEAPEKATASPNQPGCIGELESTLGRTQARLADIQGLLGELENYI